MFLDIWAIMPGRLPGRSRASEPATKIMKRPLVLGASGFLGRNLVSALAGAGEIVIAASRSPLEWAEGFAHSASIQFRKFTMEDADWDKVIDGCDVIYHLVGHRSLPTPDADCIAFVDHDIRPTIKLLEALRRHPDKRLVFVSSAGTIYGRPIHVPIAEDHPTVPISDYGISKLAAELYMAYYYRSHGIDIRVARVSNVYGAGQKPGLGAVNTFLRKALANEKIVIWGDGKNIRDYIFVSDLTRALIKLGEADLEKADELPLFNIGSGSGLSLNELLQTISKITHRELDVEYTAARGFDVPISVCDIDRAKKSLGWEPTVRIDDGIRYFAEDLRNEKIHSTK